MLKSFSCPKESNFDLNAQITWFFNMVVTAPGNTYLNQILLEYLLYRLHRKYGDDESRFKVEKEIFLSRYRDCIFDGIKHQGDIPAINWFLPGWPFQLSHKVNTQDKILVIDAARDWKTASSVSGSLTDLALLTLIGGEALFKAQSERYTLVEALSQGKLTFRKYDAEVISRLIGMRHEGDVLRALHRCFGGHIPKWWPDTEIHSDFSFYIERKLKKLYETQKGFTENLRGFCNVTTRGTIYDPRSSWYEVRPP